MASWGPEEIRQNASTWSLEGDGKLLQLMENMAKNLETRCTTTTTNINNMLLDLDDCNIAFGNTVNQFNALQHEQFVENRVYDDDDDETFTNTGNCDDDEEEKPKLIDSKDALNLTIENTINFMNNFCEKVPLKLDDSDTDIEETSNDSNEMEIENNNFIYRLKNPYQDRPVPFIIGSDEWKEKWHVGLVDSDNDSEPEDKEQYSESSGDNISLTPSNDQTISGSEGGSIWGLRQPITEVKPNVFHPSSDDDNDDYNVDDNDEDNNDVSSNVSSVKNFQASDIQRKRVQVLPVTSNTAKAPTINTNIFSEEPPEDNYAIPVEKNILKKSQKKHGLFDTESDSDQNQFSDDHLDFKPNNKNKPNEYFTKQQSTNAERKTVNLFDDEPPEPDFLSKKLPIGGHVKKDQPSSSGKKIINLFDDLDDDFDDLLTKGKAEVVPSGNRDKSNKPPFKSFLDNDDDTLSKSIVASSTKRKGIKKSIFDDDEDDDLAATGAAALPATSTVENIIDDDDFLFDSTKNKKITEQQTINKFKNLFADEDEDDFDKIFKQDKKVTETLVKHDDTSKEKKNIATGAVKKIMKTETPKVKSLFEDLDDDDDDIFGNKTAKIVEKVTKPQATSVDSNKAMVKNNSDDIFENKNTAKKQENLFEANDILNSDKKVKNTNTIGKAEDEDSDDLFGSKITKIISKNTLTKPADENIVKSTEELFPPSDDKIEEIIKPKVDVDTVLLEDDGDDFNSIFKKVDPTSIKAKAADKISLKRETDAAKQPPTKQKSKQKYISFLDDPPSDNDTADDLFSPSNIIKEAKVEQGIEEESVISKNPVAEAEISTIIDANKEKPLDKSTLIFNLDFDEPPEDDFDELFTKKNTSDETIVPKLNATKTNLSSLFGNDQPPPFDVNEDIADEDDNSYPDDDENDKSININKNDFLNNMQSIFIDNEPPPDPEFDNQFISSLLNNNNGISSALKTTTSRQSASLFSDADYNFDKEEKTLIAEPAKDVIKTNRNIYYNDFADTFIPPAVSDVKLFDDEPSSLIDENASLLEIPPEDLGKIKDVTDNLSINNNFKEKLNLFKQQPSSIVTAVSSPTPILDNVKKRSVADLIQEATIKSPDTSHSADKNLTPPKRLTKKLNKNNNLNINVAALLPGAKIPKVNNINNLSDNSPIENTDADAQRDVSIISSPKYTNNNDDDDATNNNNNEDPGKLNHLNKNRIKIQVKRRPSTRRGREENYRKSLLTIDSDLNKNFLDDDTFVTESDDLVSKKAATAEVSPPQKEVIDSNANNINELCIKDEKILALFAEEENKKLMEEKRLALAKEQQEAKDKEAKRQSHEKSKISIANQLADAETKNIVEKHSDASSKKGKSSLFDSSNDEDDDLFSKKPVTSSSSIVSKTTVNEKAKKKSLFDDEDDEDDSLFGGGGDNNTKKVPKKSSENTTKDNIVKKPSVDVKKKTNLFGESDDEDNFDDIFTPRTTATIKPSGKTPSLVQTEQVSTTNKINKKNIQKAKTKSISTTNDDPLADLLNG